MTKEENSSGRRPDPRDEAIGWWLRQKDGPLSSEDQRAFEAWLARDAANKAAFDDISGMAEHFRGLRPRPAPRSIPLDRRIWLAGSAALVVASLAIFIEFSGILAFLNSDYYASTGETKHVTLADGSQVTLNAQSAIAVHYQENERRVTLIEGEALFEIASDPARPFKVVASGGTAIALGTAFDVGQEADGTHVTVTKHRVEVESGGRSVMVEAGQQTAYGKNSAPNPPSPVDVARVTAWQRGKLIFENTPLGEVVEALARYHHGYIYLVDSDISARRVTAVFGTEDPIQAIGEIETALGLHATFLTRYLIFLHH